MDNVTNWTRDLASLEPLEEYENRYVQCNLAPLLLSPELAQDIVSLHDPQNEDNFNLLIISLLADTIKQRKLAIKEEAEKLRNELNYLLKKFNN
ncbi:hypothetical protein EV210_12316 [Anaerospora hongkongensis]|uniref:Uncharacterized protein n=1 Tax=Anaerospora hongkongensis TaxID=244830 RepID=A0A4R1PLT7_9FIRM|nr:hypothetical protein [Anaerospora hongkongensis]TCL32196.1 hypothetical protein EV210_12316 [Anaerospora hongkongensis]